MNYGLAGWMITMPILFLIALVVWALIKPDEDEWEFERKPEFPETPRVPTSREYFYPSGTMTGADIDRALAETANQWEVYDNGSA